MEFTERETEYAIEKGIVLDNFDLKTDISRVISRLRFTLNSKLSNQRLEELLALVLQTANSKVAYKKSAITSVTQNAIEIDGVQFIYPLLRFNLDKAIHLFPFVITIGNQIEAIDTTFFKSNERYSLEITKELVLADTLASLQKHLMRKYALPYIWSLVAGEMDAFPVTGQRELFNVLGQIGDAVGIKLQPDFSLYPLLSKSGIFYYTETEFEGCQVCTKEPCMMRRAQYNSILASQKGLRIRKVCGKDTA